MADLRQQLQTSLGSTYTLERELGGGGMSRVFVATESALGRHVVVKVLSPELAQGISADRFAREIRLAAGLQDPHIVPVLAAGESGGLPYYTMPYVEGESLRARLMRGEIPLNEAVGIMRDVAVALEYAHARGIVHRDIKPENVLLAGRTAVVADFGIAKAVSAARTQMPDAPAGTLTSIGQSLGTPAYMAPEQAAGDPTDHRADLYAWGMMAYELLAGRHPFADKSSAAQLMAAQVTERPEPLANRRPGLPPPLAALVMRCLEKEPAARPQRASELLQAIDGIASPGSGPVVARPASVTAPTAPASAPRRTIRVAVPVALIVATLGIGGFLLARRSESAASTAAPATAAIRRVAVLPFDNLGDSSDAYFADGITDAVRGKLTGLGDLEVIARASSAQYSRTTKPPRQIAEELGVRYLLTGTVRWAKAKNGVSRVQVSPALVEVGPDGSAANRWEQAYDAELADVFKVQGEIAGKVAEAMRVALGGTEQARLAQAPTRNQDAYDAFLRGAAISSVSGGIAPIDLRRAVAEYEQAVRLDTTFSDAWAQLSMALSRLYTNGVPTPALERRSREAADHALRLAPESPAAYRALGLVRMLVANDFEGGLQQFEKARALAPRDAEVLAQVGRVKVRLGRFDEAAEDLREAVRLDPRSAESASTLASTLLWVRRYPEAREAADRAYALLPTSIGNIEARVMVALGEGDLPRARTLLQEAAGRVNPDALGAYVSTYWDIGWALDDRAQQRVLALGPELFDNDRGSWALVRAQLYALRGDSASMRAWGDSATRELDAQLRDAPNDSQLHGLRGVALAYGGRKAEAIAASQRGVALLPATRDTFSGPYREHLLARTYLLVGEPEKALDVLERILSRPYMLSPGWLRIDPTWTPLRGHPRFVKLTTPAA